MNLYRQIVIFFFIAFSLCNLYGGDLLIEKDGNYVYSDRISVEKNKAYRNTGKENRKTKGLILCVRFQMK